MRRALSKLLVTGGAGFIGSAFVAEAVRRGYEVTVIDKLTYAADLKRLEGLKSAIMFYKADIGDLRRMRLLYERQRPEAVVNFAAESHVDRSIYSARDFIEANVKGTETLLELSRTFGVKRFIQISTDEVYGDIARGSFSEESPLRPSSPYAATKAAADLLVQACVRTYAFPALIVRPSNNYGPWQYPEKFIPLAISKILRKEKIPVYGKGTNVREWLHVRDCSRAVMAVLRKGRAGQVYNAGSGQEMRNIEVVRLLLRALRAPDGLISFVSDRPGHDIRYKLDSRKIRRETGWGPQARFAEGLAETLQWYVGHKRWLFSKWRHIAWMYKNR
ncbi:MAG TPA: dTDP-glucose 4,6-dehydratase [Patescibacteria group bacterium]|nr:dTDP-glucose 4,6-dehydratase [Patescibacteria group bacterium]